MNGGKTSSALHSRVATLLSACLLQLLNPCYPAFLGVGHSSKWSAKMLLLFETPAGFALFKVVKESKLEAGEVTIIAQLQASVAAASDAGACAGSVQGF